MEGWLENLKDWLENVVNQLFDILFVVLLGALGVALILIGISAAWTMYKMRQAGHSWQSAFQYTAQTWAYAVALGLVAAVPAAVLAVRGIFGAGIQETTRKIFGG